MTDFRRFVLNLAMKFVGTPYIWGGSSPAGGFDCSGFVIWILQVFDILPSGDWTAAGLRELFYPTADPEPGDLVLYGSGSDTITHVMMYAGEHTTLGRMVVGASGGDSKCTTIEEARRRGAQVKVKPMDYRRDRVMILDILRKKVP